MDEAYMYEQLVHGSREEANQVLLEQISAALCRPDLTVADRIKLIQEYRAIKYDMGADTEASPLAQVMEIFSGDGQED